MKIKYSNDIKTELQTRRVKSPSIVDYYEDLMDDGFTYEDIEKALGKNAAEHFASFCDEYNAQ